MPLHSLTPLSNAALLGLWRLTEAENELSALLPHPAHYAARQPTGRHAARTAQWLAGRVLTHQLLNQLHDGESVIDNDTDGRPYLPGRPEAGVSLSHSGEWVAAVVAPGGRVGTDIELIRTKAQQLAPRFLSEAERADAGDDAAKYSLYWSAKETLYKLHSRRGLVFKEQLLLDPFRLRAAGVLTGHLLLENARSQHQVHYLRPAEHYVLTYCVESIVSL